MSVLDTPLQLSNVFKPKIWGRKDLSPLFEASREKKESSPAAAGNAELIGEVWITDDESRFLNGPPAGLTLAEASARYGHELHGRSWKGQRFPILAKYIFTSDWLSVQVHPNDDYARVHDPGNVGKCEMWYIIRSDPGAQILLGFKPGATKEMLREAAAEGGSKALLSAFRPKNGEAIYVPPGSVHALGPGLVLFEVEQNSDLTYRLDDFGRVGLDNKPRPLHWGKAVDVIREDLPAFRNLPRLEVREHFGMRRYVLACGEFALEEWWMTKPCSLQSHPEHVEVYSILAGAGRIENKAGWLGYRTGETWLIPPGAGKYRIVPREETGLFKFYVPDLDQDFRKPLARRRVRQELVKKVVFD